MKPKPMTRRSGSGTHGPQRALFRSCNISISLSGSLDAFRRLHKGCRRVAIAIPWPNAKHSPRSECRDDPSVAILVELLEEALGCVRVPLEADAADLAEGQHDVVLDGEQEFEEGPIHERPELGLG